jgi:hypothetical protein
MFAFNWSRSYFVKGMPGCTKRWDIAFMLIKRVKLVTHKQLSILVFCKMACIQNLIDITIVLVYFFVSMSFGAFTVNKEGKERVGTLSRL